MRNWAVFGQELQRDIYAFDFSYYAGVCKMGEARGTKVDKKIGEIERLLKSKREEILEIAARHGAINVRIFGSASRGEAGEESDIDLLVDVGPGRTPFFPGGLLADLEELLGWRVDVVTAEGLHWYIRDRVLNEAVPL